MATRREVDRQGILDAIEKANGNLAKAARIYGVSRSTLFRNIKTFKIRLRGYFKGK